MVNSNSSAPRMVRSKSVKYARPNRKPVVEPSSGIAILSETIEQLVNKNISDLSNDEIKEFGNMRLYGILYSDQKGIIKTTRLGESFHE